MHFFVDKDNKVGGMHIEMWDSNSLGPKLEAEVESYKGKKLNEFLKFVLKKRIFMHLRILYFMRPGEGGVWFWASPAWQGKESVDTLIHSAKAMNIGGAKYGIFNIKIKGQKKKDEGFNAVLFEDALAFAYSQLGFGSEKIDIELTGEEARDISIDFNVSRNSAHMIRNAVNFGGKEQLMNMQLKGARIVGVKSKGSMEIFKPEELKKLSKKELEGYSTFSATKTEDPKETKEIDKIFERIKKLRGVPNSEQSPEPAKEKAVDKNPKKKTSEKIKKEEKSKEAKPKKKGFFSKLFG